jgi:mitochondrial fission protein ELM1
VAERHGYGVSDRWYDGAPPPPGPTPRVWVLETEASGDNAQLRILAEALGWASELKPLVFNRLVHLRNPLLGASRLAVDRGRSARLDPPWPDLVLSSGRFTVPVARWIWRRSGGRTRLVHLGRVGASPERFDLVLAMPQYNVAPGPRVFAARLPFNRIAPARLAAAAARWRPRLERLPQPWITLLVGGPATPLGLDTVRMREIALAVAAEARALGGSVLVSTSRRTPPEVGEILDATLPPPKLVHRWRANDPDNPYPAFLALADRVVVTADSASMLAEACRAGKPVAVAPLPVRPGPRVRANSWMARTVPALYDRLVGSGFVMAVRDLPRFHAELRAADVIRFLGEPPMAQPPRLLDDLPDALAAIRALLSDDG